MGRHREFRPERSGHRRWFEGPALGLRPLYLVLLTFVPFASAEPNDCLMQVSVSSAFAPE
jgi:hypothetical protein